MGKNPDESYFRQRGNLLHLCESARQRYVRPNQADDLAVDQILKLEGIVAPLAGGDWDVDVPGDVLEGLEALWRQRVLVVQYLKGRQFRG